MRRWWTFYDAGRALDKIWHTMLMGLMVWFYVEGQDPYAVAAATPEVYRVKLDDTEAQKNYKIRAQTLVTLMSSTHQRILRSTLVCFQRAWTEHKQYTELAYNAPECLRFLKRWSSPGAWLHGVVAPALRDAFSGRETMRTLGFRRSVDHARAPLLQDNSTEDDNEDAQLLTVHVRNAMSMLGQLMEYTTLHLSPPGLSTFLLDAAARPLAVAYLKRVWALVTLLESSHDPSHRDFGAQLVILKWAVVREVLELCVSSDWDFSHPCGERALKYVGALFSGVQNTLALENGFNDLRDNEARGARHKQRASQTLQALSISSQHTRYQDNAFFNVARLLHPFVITIAARDKLR